MRLKQFDDIALQKSMTQDDIPLDFVQATSKYPGLAGAFDHFGFDQIREPLTIRRKVRLVETTTSDIGDLLDQLRKRANRGKRWLTIEMTDSAERGTWAKLTQIRAQHKIDNLKYLDVDLTFLVTWPWFEDTSDIWYLDATEVLDDGLTLDSNSTARSGAGTLSITNNGGDAITRGQITITGASANPTVTNGANDYSISYSGSIPAGSQLFLDYGAQRAEMDGATAWPNITLGSEQVSMFRLETGLNTITFTGGGDIRISWAEVY